MKNEQQHRTVSLTKLDPKNDSHWISHNEWKKIVAKGAPQPSGTSAFWNDWAARNPTPEAIALMGLDIATPVMASMTAISKGAQPVDLFSEIVSMEEYGNNL